MKHSIFFLLFVVATLCASAQNTLMATLDHQGQKSVFFGTNAINQANAAACDSDIITLSGGIFTSATLTKAVTLRGTGVYANDDAQLYPTVINGSINLNIADKAHKLIIEGIKITDGIYSSTTTNDPLFKRCIIRCFGAHITNAIFENCYIYDYMYYGSNCSATFLNCYVQTPNYYNYSGNRYDFLNCVIKSMSTSTQYSHFRDCIFLNTGALNSTNVAFNCLATGTGASNVFNNLNNGNQNYYVEDITTIFKEYNGSNYSDNITFELTDEAARTYLCADGTQIGMYGGSCPFDFSIAALKLTKCVVSNRATADGKINVDIEVEGIK